MNSLIVYTAIVGPIDDILTPIQVPADVQHRPIRYICFSDSNIACPAGWELRQIVFKDRNHRLTSRWHKIMSHLVFPEAEFTLWHDGSHHLRVNPWYIIDGSLRDGTTFATFKHPARDCVYQEIRACIELKKDTSERLSNQGNRYLHERYPVRGGLFEACCLARCGCKPVASLNELWWEEIQRGSCRDQVSLPYAVWKLRFNDLGILPGSRERSKFFVFRPHRS